MTAKKSDKPQPASAPGMENEYGHSSGDRNTRDKAHDWKIFKDGKERTEHTEPPRRTDAKGGSGEKRSG